MEIHWVGFFVILLTQQPINQEMDMAENITFLAEVIKRQTEEDVQYANIQHHMVTTTTTHSRNKQGAAYNQSHLLLPAVAAISLLA